MTICRSLRRRIVGLSLGPVARAARIVPDREACLALPPSVVADTVVLRALIARGSDSAGRADNR